ncbi:hypothetical protein KCU60_g26, partial [Aureobasidium melanogenum]
LSDLLERRRHDTVHESVDFSKHCSGRFQHLGSQKCSCSRIDKNHERNVRVLHSSSSTLSECIHFKARAW